MIRFGLAYDQFILNRTHAAAFEEAVRSFHLAEKYGFECIWSGEGHPVRPEHGHLPAPLIIAALVAAQTHRIRVGTAVLLLPLYDPLRLAEDVAVLDAYTGGRLILGVGLGHRPLLDRASIPAEHAGERMNEQLTLLRKFWGEPPVDYDGAHFHYHHVRVVPKPAQGPTLPIWIGGFSEAAIRRAATLGDAWIGATQYTLGMIKNAASRYQAALREAGKAATAPVIAANRVTYVARDGDSARAEARKPVGALLGWYRERGSLRHPDGTLFAERDMDPDRLYPELCFIGSPEEVIEQVHRAHKETGLNDVECRVRLPGLRAEQVEAGIQLLGERVLPYFADSPRR